MPRHALRSSAVSLATFFAALAIAPGAQADTSVIAPPGSGITAPAGIARDNGGGIWVSDAIRGVCKVDTTVPGAGKLVEDGTWCQAPAPAPPEVVGAPPPPPPSRPEATFQLAFDPATNSLFVAEGSSKSSGIWRLHIDPATSTITDGKRIVAEADRVFGLALGVEGSTPVLDYTSKRTQAIERILDPATCNPCEPVGSGAALDKGAPALASLDGALYIAEATGVTRIPDPGPAGAVAQPVAGFPGGVPTALAADPARGRVYAGTTNANHLDQVDVFKPASGVVETYATGLNAVTALAVDPNGDLLVADDPLLGAETTLAGRVLSVGLGAVGAPVALIDTAPATFSTGGDVKFTFTGPAGTSFECRMDPAGAGAPWEPCGAAPWDSYREAGSMSEGSHVFEVRAVSADPELGTGPVQRRTFVVDRAAPTATVDNAAADHVLTGTNSIAMRFSSNEQIVAFSCSLDGGAPAPCSDPKRYTGLALGDHVFAVTATDAAGNASAPVVWPFTVREAPAAVAPAGLDGSSAPTFNDDSRVVAPRFSAALRPLSVRLRSASSTTLAKIRRSRRIVVRVLAPDTARLATVSLYRTTKRTVSPRKSPLAFATLRLSGTGRDDIALRLTARQAKALRAGHYLVGVVLTDGASRFGPSRNRRLTIHR